MSVQLSLVVVAFSLIALIFSGVSGGDNDLMQRLFCQHHKEVSLNVHRQQQTMHSSGRKQLNLRGFKCPFHWTSSDHLKNKLRDWIKERQKMFNRFTVPVMGYSNPDLSLFNYTGLLTWVWVRDNCNYMLHYPHNFVRLSLWTMGIVTGDWALDYNTKEAALKLSTYMDIDDKNYEYEGDIGHCDSDCVTQNRSCGVDVHDIAAFLNCVVNDSSVEYPWQHICLQLPYEDIYHAFGSHTYIIPDVLYYTLFLRRLLTERPMLGFSHKKKTFLLYYCYERTNLSHVGKPKELFMKYYVVFLLAIVLWLYSPLLIHYFPSSSVKVDSVISCPQDMISSHKMPIYFGRCLKWLLCMYVERGGCKAFFLVRIRRLIFLCLVFVSLFRLFQHLFFLRALPCFMIVVSLILVAISYIYPAYISTYISPSVIGRYIGLSLSRNITFMCWELPLGLVQLDPDVMEYQLLSAVMRERIYLLINGKFWRFVASMCFKRFNDCSKQDHNYFLSFWFLRLLSVLWGVLLLAISIVVYFTYYFFPFPYFIRELSPSVLYSQRSSQQSHVLAMWMYMHRILVLTCIYIILGTVFFWCYALVEFSTFTVIGGMMLPSMAFPYFILVGSFVKAIHKLVHSLHEDYKQVMEKIAKVLDSKGLIAFLSNTSELKLFIKIEDDEIYTLSVQSSDNRYLSEDKTSLHLMKKDLFLTYLSRRLYDFVVQTCYPLHKQVFFIAIQVGAMVFYGVVAMWVKNVYHLEEQVGSIIDIVYSVAIAFVPGIVQFMAFEIYFGKKEEAVSDQKVFVAITKFLGTL